MTAPYSPAPRFVPDPMRQWRYCAFNSIFPNVRVAPVLPRYSVGVPAVFARRIEPRMGLPGGSAYWNSYLIVVAESAVALACAGQRIEPTWLVMRALSLNPPVN